LPVPGPYAIAQYFLATYGSERLFFTAVPLDPTGRAVNASTFGQDNMHALLPWVVLQTAKFVSGSVSVLAMVVRVFDPLETVEHFGPTGRIRIPVKDLYMFRCSPAETIGFDASETSEMHTTDAETGDVGPPENGVRYCSSLEIVASLRPEPSVFESS
jgi:hypothetical protein